MYVLSHMLYSINGKRNQMENITKNASVTTVNDAFCKDNDQQLCLNFGCSVFFLLSFSHVKISNMIGKKECPIFIKNGDNQTIPIYLANEQIFHEMIVKPVSIEFHNNVITNHQPKHMWCIRCNKITSIFSQIFAFQWMLLQHVQIIRCGEVLLRLACQNERHSITLVSRVDRSVNLVHPLSRSLPTRFPLLFSILWQIEQLKKERKVAQRPTK